jgi:hypothetical protein
MPEPHKEVSEDQLLEQLRDILLREDRTRLEELQIQLNDPKQLNQRVAPLIERELVILKEHFPDAYFKVVDNMIQARLKTSQKEILDNAYPVMGKMIRKYVQLQFDQLREEINDRIYETFNTGILGRIKYALFGFSNREKEWMLAQSKMAQVEEVFVVEQHSGILLGSASSQETIDRDLVAGMLTAIKSFVEDAFKQGGTDLECIQYGNYAIHVYNYFTCYLAVVVIGTLTREEKEFLDQRTRQFAEKSLLSILRNVTGNKNLAIRQKLEKVYFTGRQIPAFKTVK